MSATFLRIYHNGNVLVKNPHWHLGVSPDGKISGEVLPREGIRREFHEQLAEAEAQTLFQTADALSRRFPPVEQHVGHCHDDVCVQGSEPGRVLYRYIVPPKEQRQDSVVEFLQILNRVIEKYAG
jgi:hypothetical protein